MTEKKRTENRYTKLIESIFLDGYREGITEVPFHRDALAKTARRLRVTLPKNLGDAIYSIRYRMHLPDSIARTQPPGQEWIIEGRGKSRYAFRLVSINRILPNPQIAEIKIPDATPEIVSAYALSDEQALLAKVRYNRLLDIFLGVAAYSLQNHLRTTVSGLGQVEIDEIYVAVDARGRQFVIPVQAKGGSDRLSTVQTRQDMACCSQKFPQLICRPISAQFVATDLIALFALREVDKEIRIVEEKHYKLVPFEQIAPEDLRIYDS
ncbi:MAG TPA: endonuclease [Candidatus Paceibacterota bacterium]|nr:endonuclease [Candidatus Paceibacterota bacterium]HRZ57557.1 endonuclease [Candidatus Paceibacterota bacterium]